MIISMHLCNVFVVYLKITRERTIQVLSTCRCMEEDASHKNFQLWPIIAPLQDMKQGLQREMRKEKNERIIIILFFGMQCIGHSVILQITYPRINFHTISYYYDMFTIFPTYLGLEALYPYK
jgi:hypothetical protein